MSAKRIAQVNEFIRKELASLLNREIEFPPGNLVTITKVDTAADLKAAKVWLSILPAEQQNAILHLLAKKRGHLQRLLNPRLRLRNTPVISFAIDETEERASRIEHLLDELKKRE